MSELPPRLDPPDEETVREIAEEYHMSLSDDEVSDFTDLVTDKMGVYEVIDRLPEPERTVKYTDRDPGYRPDEDEDPLNAFVRKCHVAGADEGPLAGYEVAVKDSIPVASIEMNCGSSVMRGYVPQTDATVVERLLEAGVTITGTTNMDSWAVSGSGELTDIGPITNPHSEGHLAGGSSGGSAVAVVTGDVDLALGTDQAGSVRVPAAWCGCVGLKPTFGLVPYTGAVSGGHMYDHIGPIAETVTDCARALDVLAGSDSRDPRQGPVVPVEEYQGNLGAEPDDLTVGVLVEGFADESGDVDPVVRTALSRFGDQGATVEDVSIPWHRYGPIIWNGMTSETSTSNFRDEGVGMYRKGYYDTQWVREFANARRARADDLPPTQKLSIISGQYVRDRYYGYYHAKAQNLNRKITADYDDALDSVDVLAMPTTPMPAFEKTTIEDRKHLINRAQGKKRRGKNTMIFNVTGHPAISVPCGTIDGLPAGLMFVGKRFDDTSVLRVAEAFERTVDWTRIEH